MEGRLNSHGDTLPKNKEQRSLCRKFDGQIVILVIFPFHPSDPIAHLDSQNFCLPEN